MRASVDLAKRKFGPNGESKIEFDWHDPTAELDGITDVLEITNWLAVTVPAAVVDAVAYLEIDEMELSVLSATFSIFVHRLRCQPGSHLVPLKR